MRVAGAFFLALGLGACTTVQAGAPAVATMAEIKPRVVVMTDIGDDPDDEQSMVRLMLYSNELDIEGLIATTSVYHRGAVRPDLIHRIIDGYGAVENNLRVHAAGFPTASSLHAKVHAGDAAYGMQGVGAGQAGATSDWIIRTIDAKDPRPIWFLIWGGAHDLAQALWTVKQTRSADDFSRFVGKVRVYSISEQDDSGPWMRRTFPSLFYIASVHAAWQYPAAAWTGMGGDPLFHFEGADPRYIAPEWIDRNIRYGPLGRVYPPVKYTMEGDSPTILYLLPTGLGDPGHPEYGGWGGRYGLPLGDGLAYADAEDAVTGVDGKIHLGNPETVWRWRSAVQADMAARVRWSVSARWNQGDHAPLVLLNGTGGTQPLLLSARSGQSVALSSDGSSDPDGDRLKIRWFPYAEPAGGYFNPPLQFDRVDTRETRVTLPKVDKPLDYHVILEVSEDRAQPLVRYRRAIIHVTP